MHPEILRELTAQRSQEMQARARHDGLVRMAIRAARRARNPQGEIHSLVMPTIPDYVDGTFRTDAAGAERAPAGSHAA